MGWLNLGQHGIQNPPGDPSHCLPHTPHVGVMGWIKDSCTAFLAEEPEGKKLMRSVCEAGCVYGLEQLYMNSMHTETGKDHCPPLPLVAPPCVCRVEILQGPNTSMPTLVNVGIVLNRSEGRSAIFCSAVLPLSFLVITHLYKCLAMHLLTLAILKNFCQKATKA